ncbi:hypothetical protein EZ449_21325 [Pedobacter frigidisoli]|uniref:Uncharacterized protein n=2 Tax=Pedobacter frigidisoli TaxID=2530455 RepID=A0A4V2MKW0_9SPHI|nr:hypothetical protein EZ449_21325 [Pedobacter frigidisoli]
MFFHHLKNFSPYSGHIYNEMRTGIVRKHGELISKNDSRFDLIKRIGYFPFRELRRIDQAYFISDLELFEFFQTTEQTLKDYDVEAYSNWGYPAKEELLNVFLEGYRHGLNEFRENIGITYSTLSHNHKIEYLRNFCLYCLDFLYFDGELDKALFYNLGYIQANLYMAYVEVNNLNALTAINHSETETNAPTNNLPSNATQSTEEPERIEIYCDVTDIKKIWQVLTAPINTGKGIEQPIFSEEELEKYLGSMFYSGAFPDAFKHAGTLSQKTISRGHMRNVLIALMYSCYSLNRNFDRRSNQIMYVAMLKRYFSVFATSEIESIKSVFATYAPKGIDVLKNNLGKNPHVEEILSILKIHKLLH